MRRTRDIRKAAAQNAGEPEDEAGDDDRANQMRDDAEALVPKGGAENQLQSIAQAVAMASV